MGSPVENGISYQGVVVRRVECVIGACISDHVAYHSGCKLEGALCHTMRSDPCCMRGVSGPCCSDSVGNFLTLVAKGVGCHLLPVCDDPDGFRRHDSNAAFYRISSSALGNFVGVVDVVPLLFPIDLSFSWVEFEVFPSLKVVSLDPVLDALELERVRAVLVASGCAAFLGSVQ